MSDTTSSPSAAERSDRITAVLADRYGLAVRTLTQLPIGQGTVNFRATCDGGREVFVKNYPDGTDLPAERQAIALSTLALQGGVPGAPVVVNRHGQVIDTSGPLAVSVWEWMPGQVVTRLSPAQLAAAGSALGRIHALFADLPAVPTDTVRRWHEVDVQGLTATIDRLLEVIGRRSAAGTADGFDTEARRTLIERRDMLTRVPELLADLPAELTAQVVHGDYSPVNLLFSGDELTAVLDFRPPDPFLVAYDLGRMAFYPNTVTGDPDWPQAAATLIGAYLDVHPAVSGIDVRACGRVALLQLLKSLYGVKQHYLAPGLFQDDLDEFWLLRHHAAHLLLDRLPEIDALLADLASSAIRR